MVQESNWLNIKEYRVRKHGRKCIVKCNPDLYPDSYFIAHKGKQIWWTSYPDGNLRTCSPVLFKPITIELIDEIKDKIIEKNRIELITSREYWVAKINCHLNSNSQMHTKECERLAELCVNEHFLKVINEIKNTNILTKAQREIK